LNARPAANRRSPLRQVAIACHALLIATLAAAAVTFDATASRALVAALIVAPLLATLPGLVRGRREVEHWLAVLLVLYVGATSVEVVARAGAAPLVSAALLAAVAELGLLLALIRRSRDRSPTAHE
jgi:uncharacterized membrane protein